jgi:hypothetical protein
MYFVWIQFLACNYLKAILMCTIAHFVQYSCIEKCAVLNVMRNFEIFVFNLWRRPHRHKQRSGAGVRRNHKSPLNRSNGIQRFIFKISQRRIPTLLHLRKMWSQFLPPPVRICTSKFPQMAYPLKCACTIENLLKYALYL